MSASSLPQAPGAKAAKVCGILAIVLALTCVGIPVAITLAIVALVQQAKAKRLVQAEPGAYAPVPATGLVTGIIGLVLPLVMLPFAGIVSAIAIPALLSQRAHAREMVLRRNLDLVRIRAEALVAAWQAGHPGQAASQETLLADLLKDPELRALRNPVEPGAPALVRGQEAAFGAVAVFADREEAGGVTTWSIKLRVRLHAADGEPPLEREVVTHTQEQVHSRTEDGWEVVAPPAELPAPSN